MTHYSDRSLTTSCGLQAADVETVYGVELQRVDCPQCRRALGLVRLDARDRAALVLAGRREEGA